MFSFVNIVTAYHTTFARDDAPRRRDPGQFRVCVAWPRPAGRWTDTPRIPNPLPVPSARTPEPSTCSARSFQPPQGFAGDRPIGEILRRRGERQMLAGLLDQPEPCVGHAQVIAEFP